MLITNAPKGTKDVLPGESYKWQYIESVIRDVCHRFNYKEVRIPAFEHTELFLRGVGDTTDIVNKEMYTFNDKGGRSITLKPEGTAGTARCFIQNKLYAGVMPQKMYYLNSPVFRYERPQAGRLREHHQFGIEAFGSLSATIDAEIIQLAMTVFKELNIENLVVNINSIGCSTCRAKYNEALKAYLKDNIENMCKSCGERFEKNPMRILDCKVSSCKEIVQNAPTTLDYLCEECQEHFEALKDNLDAMGISYEVNPMIVRGLDYYTKTVFEIITTSIGAQGTVCGGGRYDNLTKELGGPDTPSAGFGMGMERLLLLMENDGIVIPQPESLDLYIAALGREAQLPMQKIASDLRNQGASVECAHMGRSLKAQMKYANKLHCQYVLIIGEDEIKSGYGNLRKMSDGSEQKVALDKIAEVIKHGE